MWSGFSSEIETDDCRTPGRWADVVACGAASRLRLKRGHRMRGLWGLTCRMWSGFSSEIETSDPSTGNEGVGRVACGAASRLRLKPVSVTSPRSNTPSRMWSGFSSEIETWVTGTTTAPTWTSHVERLLV